MGCDDEQGTDGDEPYLRYLRYLHKNRPALGPIESFGSGYEDVLQCPLQPLMDNLDSTTYEIFEQVRWLKTHMHTQCPYPCYLYFVSDV